MIVFATVLDVVELYFSSFSARCTLHNNSRSSFLLSCSVLPQLSPSPHPSLLRRGSFGFFVSLSRTTLGFSPPHFFFCDAVAGKTFPRAGSPGTDGKGTCESHPRSRQTGKLFGRQCSPPPRFPRQPPYCQYGHSSTTPFSPAGNSVFQAPRAVGSGSCELPRFDCPRVFVGRGICPLYPTTSSCVCRKCDRYRDSMCTNFFVDRGVLLARHLAIASPPRAFVVGSKRRDANAP